ncbi:hypothetical protein [Paenibacillus polymyxa]|uniref:hypothetical protein n=1 Tax=Paenibacillus polymyxa TaxID=1406 RepID=UPI0003112543|nr:hypothetical protein [Paenibacillus polymyxa]AJW69127.1 hypothetical protein PPE_05215 [Paenibacillus polymyxa E681]
MKPLRFTNTTSGLLRIGEISLCGWSLFYGGKDGDMKSFIVAKRNMKLKKGDIIQW